ncbi:unnamed protein product [Parajaminaea phylloscopi]
MRAFGPLGGALALLATVTASILPGDEMDLVQRWQKGNSSWPHGPLVTKGRWIENQRGEKVTLVGTNWPLSGETMVPEGLEYASARDIVESVASLGMNVVRHGYAIQMVDEIHSNGGKDVDLRTSMINGLGQENGTRVLKRLLEKNREFGWTESTTRFEVLAKIAELEAEHGILMHLDNHVSKAKWCCSHIDGNGWFGDVYFDVKNWTRGLAHMADWAKKHKNIQTISLRNELRESWNVTDLEYNWLSWAGNMTLGANAVHEANSDLLITVSGLQYDQDLSAFASHLNLNTAPAYRARAVRDGHRRKPVYFDPYDHPWGKNVVLELHLYGSSEDIDTGTCETIEASLYRSGANVLGIKPPKGCRDGKCPKAYREYPLFLSEFGQAENPTLYNNTLTNCLRKFTTENKVSWSQWSLAGSYRAREGQQDVDDSWGLKKHDWSGWRDPATIEGFWKKWVKDMGKTGL